MLKPLNLLANQSNCPQQKQRPLLAEITWGFAREQLVKWHAARLISRERKALRDLSDSALQDLNITREQANQEAARAFFDIPNQRLPMFGLLDTAKEKQSIE